MSNDNSGSNKTSKFDLEERTSVFSENIIRFCKQLPSNPVSLPIITQLIRSGTSIGANYCEADDAESKKDFIHKIGISKKEAREVKYWLRILLTVFPDSRSEIKTLWLEAKEIHLILNAIIKTSRANLVNKQS